MLERVESPSYDFGKSKRTPDVVDSSGGGVAGDDAVVCGYDGRMDFGFAKHLRINKSKHFANSGVPINGIESFWSFTKRRLAKFNGVKKYLPLHLKECEWRWNKNTATLVSELTRMMV